MLTKGRINLDWTPYMHFWDRLHHPLQSMGSLHAKINKTTRCEWLWSSYKMYKTYQKKATKDKIYMNGKPYLLCAYSSQV